MATQVSVSRLGILFGLFAILFAASLSSAKGDYSNKSGDSGRLSRQLGHTGNRGLELTGVESGPEQPFTLAPVLLRRPARSLDDEFVGACESGEHECSGSSCYHQCLKCIGGEFTSTTACCATCCNSGGCVTVCCTST